MTNIAALITSILMAVTIGVGQVIDPGNPWLAVCGIYGWLLVGFDAMVKIE